MLRRHSQWRHVFFRLGSALCVAGQMSNVTQCVPSYVWSINSMGQTPCLIAAYLESLCGVPTSVSAIPAGTHYLGPTLAEQDPCKCSSVTYAVVSACGGCQGRTFQNWTTWSQSCGSVEIATFPKSIPEEVQVPIWAYINVSLTNNNFDPIVAQQTIIAGNLPTSSPPSLSAVSTPPVSTSSSAALAASSDNSVSEGSTSNHSNPGAIAGGVIGGLAVLAVVSLILIWWFARRRRTRGNIAFDNHTLVSGPGTVASQNTSSLWQSPSSGPLPVSLSQSSYSASAGALPMSPVLSGVYTSPQLTSRRSLESVSPSMIQLGGYQPQPSLQPRGYRGVAELQQV